MLLGERTALATDSLHVCKLSCATNLNDIDVGGRPSQTVVFRDHETTQAMNLCRTGELRVDVVEERPPRFVELFSRHSRADQHSPSRADSNAWLLETGSQQAIAARLA
jgi:hypothetical protein